MRRYDYCGKGLGLIVHRKWRWRFCKLSCEKTGKRRQRKELQRPRQWFAYPSGSVSPGLCNRSQHGIGDIPKLDPYTTVLKSARLQIDQLSFRSFATRASLRRGAICTRTTDRYLPLSALKIETSPSSSSNRLLPNTSIAPRLRLMRKIFWRLPGACARIMRSVSARIAERSCQLFAPVVECSLWGEGSEIEGIGARLAREDHATLDNDVVPVGIPRLNHHTLLFLRLRQGGLW
jgi:hypothetical protein